MFTLQIDINMAGTKQKAPPPAKPAEPAAANHSNPPIPPNLHLNPGPVPNPVTPSKAAPPAQVKAVPASASLPPQYEGEPEPLYQSHMPKRLRKKACTRYIKVYHLKGGVVDYRKSNTACEKFELKHRGRIQKEAPWKNPEGYQLS